MIEECDQRKKREANVVIFGLVEKPNGPLDVRNCHDAEQFKSLFEALDLPKLDVVAFRRIGSSRGNGERPLLVSLKNVDQKMQLIKASVTLRKLPMYRKVFVNFDLTPMQQEKRKRLMAELKSRRNRGEDVVIFKNEVVPRKSKQDF